MSEIKKFTGGEKQILTESYRCETIINSDLLLDSTSRANFSKLYYTLCTSQTIGEGGFYIGEINGTDLDGNNQTVQIVFHPKINDQVISFIDSETKQSIALRETEPKLHVIPLDGSRPFSEELGENGLRSRMRKAMDVYFSTLSPKL